jgi:hypothetical protein
MKSSPSLLARALGAASAAAMLCAVPAMAKAEPMKKGAPVKTAPTKQKLTSSESQSTKLKTETLGSFTPPMLDSVRKNGGGVAIQERTFRFTPSGNAADRKALSIGVTSRVVRANAPDTARPADTETTTAYNVDVAVGWLGFAISGGISRLDSVLEPGREGLDLGLSYRGNRWKTALQLNAEDVSDGMINPLGLDKRYSVELGGAYALSSRLSLLGGVKYQLMEPEAFGRNFVTRSGQPLASEGEAGTVYLGGSISF